MSNTIPANDIVSVTPSVLSAGGIGLALNGTILTESARPPIAPLGALVGFSNADDVGDYFGPSSQEEAMAAVYFLGFNNSNVKPGLLYFTQYPAAAVAAYLRGAPVTGLSLAALGALSGSLTVLMDGVARVAASVNLTGATSYSNAASIIQTALNLTPVVGGSGSASTIAGTLLTIGGTVTGVFAVGQTLTGAGISAGTIITALGTGTGGAGTYQVNNTQTISSQVIGSVATPLSVSFDSVSGAFVIASGITGVAATVAYATGTLATPIFLTQATGAVISQGAAATNPNTFMSALAQQNQNWASFTTTFDPDNGSGNAIKLQFAQWNNLQDNRYLYVAWDTDVSPTVTVPATDSLGQLLKAGNISGTFPLYDPTDANATIAAFVLSIGASIDFNQLNGRITYKFKGQTGLIPTVGNQSEANNLRANGYNFYGVWATAADQFIGISDGVVSGPFKFADAYINEIWLNNNLQLALMTLLFQINAVPYNAAGYALIEQSCASAIQAGLNFGAFSKGVLLSSLQIAEVNNAAGVAIDRILFAQGWYFQVVPATAQIRANRQSPECTFWYCDAGAVHQINLASVEIQ